MNKFFTFRTFVFTGLLLTGSVGIAIPRLPAGEMRIVLVEGATIYAGDQPVQVLSRGQLVEVEQQQQVWLAIPAFGGWLHESKAMRLRAAEQELDARVHTQPTAVDHQLRGIVRQALEQSEGAVEDFLAARALGLSSAALAIQLGNVYQEQERYAEAMKEFTEAIRLDPRQASAYENRAGVLHQMGQYTASLADSDRSIAIDPSRAQSFNNRGVTRRQLGQIREALADFDEAVRLRPDFLDARFNRALTHLERGDEASAILDYEAVLRSDPNHADTLNDFAWLLATSPRAELRNGTRAVELIERAIRMQPEADPDFLDTLAAACAEAGEFTRAVTIQRELVAQFGETSPDIAKRLQSYEASKPYRELPSPANP